MLARELSSVRIPVVAVLGNHDVESCQTSRRRPRSQGYRCLGSSTATRAKCWAWASRAQRDSAAVFGKRALAPWGETVLKEFAREAVEEALKLEKALTRLRTPSSSSR